MVKVKIKFSWVAAIITAAFIGLAGYALFGNPNGSGIFDPVNLARPWSWLIPRDMLVGALVILFLGINAVIIYLATGGLRFFVNTKRLTGVGKR